ncbi:hypothetical protein MHU86_6552 [Fragilaria crotonensis]|nr:hypothetical protein MHU86_6552 [Fragilaria crotonensis]
MLVARQIYEPAREFNKIDEFSSAPNEILSTHYGPFGSFLRFRSRRQRCADDDCMDSYDDEHENENVPVTAPAELTIDLTETEIKHDDFVEEFLLRLENGGTTSFESTAADDGGVDASAGNAEDALLAAAAERTTDETEDRCDDFVGESQTDLPTVSMSSDPSAVASHALLPLIEVRNLAPSDDINGLDHAPLVESLHPTGLRNVDSGAYPISSDSNTATRPASAFPTAAYGSTTGFADESKEEEEVPNYAGAPTNAHDSNGITGERGLQIVEAQPVHDVDEEGSMIVAEAHHVTIKWYQRPFYRWILVGSTLFTTGLIVVVIVLVTRPSAAPGSSLLQPPTLAPSEASPPTPVPSLLTPEQIACNFLSTPNVTMCRSKVVFDSWNNGNIGDNTTGSTIPTEIGLMTQLTYLDFYNNQLNSTVPSEIGLLSNLTLLSIWKNQLTSTIPTEITRLTDLLFLDFLYNQLTGTIPSEMALMTKLIRWDVSNNRLTSTFPSEMGLLTDLTYLSFYSNRLSGTIPTEIALLTNLLYFYTSSNQLTSTIPTEMALMTQLTELDYYNNQLAGTIPSSLCSLGYMMIWIDCDKISCASGCCISGTDGFPSCG